MLSPTSQQRPEAPQDSNPFRKTATDLFLLALFVLTAFAPQLFTSQIFVCNDLVQEFYARHLFIQQTLQQGALPLWNPYTGCGEPQLADPEGGLFYPPNALFHFLPVGFAQSLSLAFHTFLGAMGVYLLCRFWAIARAGALLAAVIFAFNSFALCRLEIVAWACTAAWQPITILAYALWLKHRVWKYLLLLAALFALQYLAGYPEGSVFSLGSVFLYGLCATYFQWRESPGLRSLATPLLGMAAAGALAMGLCLFQLLPTAEATLHSTRGVMDPRLDQGSFNPGAWFTLILPTIYGALGSYGRYWGPSTDNYWMGNIYIGMAPIIIACLVAVLRLSRRTQTTQPQAHSDWTTRIHIPYLLLVLLCFGLYAMGKYTPFFSFIWHTVPIVQGFRWPVKSLMCVVFALSCLSGILFDNLLRLTSRNDESRRPTVLYTLGFLALVSTVGAVTVLVGDGAVGKSLLHRYFNLDSVEPFFAHRIPWDLITRDTIKIPVLVVVLAGVFATFLFRPRRMAWLGVAVAAITFCDLLYTSSHVLRLDSPAVLKPDSAAHKTMIPGDEPFRFDPSNSGNSYEDRDLYAYGPESMLGFWPAAEGAFRLARATPFTLAHFKAVETALLDPATSPPARRRLYAMLNLRYILHHDMDTYFRGEAMKPLRVEELPKPMPRAYVVGGVKGYETDAMVIRALTTDRFDPWAVALTEASQSDLLPDTALTPGTVDHTITRLAYLPNALSIDVESARDALLVISDTHYPGWHAQVNGQPAPIIRVNGAFRGVPIDAGPNEVRMVYRPASFRLGLYGSAFTLVLIAAISLYAIRAGHRRKPGV